VADTIKKVRPDLTLKVEGFADSRPKVKESGDDIESDRRANRRAELRYQS